MIEVKAQLRRAQISAKKVRLVADAIRGLDVVKAEARLQVIFKKSSQPLDKLLKSAIANAHDRYEVKTEDLFIKSILVNKGVDTKRWKPSAFGRAHPFSKHSCSVILTLGLKEGATVKSHEKKAAEVSTVDLTKVEPKAAAEAKKAGAKDKKFKDKINPLKKIKDTQNLDRAVKGVKVKKG
ncbi:MAG: 50S ribosomal protein L22 [Patescibacteria group bacterium]